MADAIGCSRFIASVPWDGIFPGMNAGTSEFSPSYNPTKESERERNARNMIAPRKLHAEESQSQHHARKGKERIRSSHHHHPDSSRCEIISAMAVSGRILGEDGNASQEKVLHNVKRATFYL